MIIGHNILKNLTLNRCEMDLNLIKIYKMNEKNLIFG